MRGYDIPRNAMVGRRGLVVGHGHFIAEGIFAGERRKPPMVLLRRGLMLMRTEPAIIRRALDVGCIPLTPSQAETRLRRRLTGSAARRA